MCLPSGQLYASDAGGPHSSTKQVYIQLKLGNCYCSGGTSKRSLNDSAESSLN